MKTNCHQMKLESGQRWLDQQKYVLRELTYKREVNSLIFSGNNKKGSLNMDIRKLSIQEIQPESNEQTAFICDINTGICGLKAIEQASSDKKDLLKYIKKESEEKE